jgi:hypothetical protein
MVLEPSMSEQVKAGCTSIGSKQQLRLPARKCIKVKGKPAKLGLGTTAKVGKRGCILQGQPDNQHHLKTQGAGLFQFRQLKWD